MKKIFTLIIFSFIVFANAQQKQDEVNTQSALQQRSSSSSSSSSSNSGSLVDAVLPANSPFQLGKNIEGAIQNSINKSSGKVLFSLPIASVTANTVGYNVSLSYNGAAAFEMAKKTNKFNPTGILGVGFNFSVPKIITDYKNTAVRDDDTFYFADGNNSKLICTKKTDTYLEFQSEKYVPWKIKYIIKRSTGFTQLPSGQWIETFVNSDSWEVIKEDGTIYLFGEEGHSNGNNSKVYVSTWGNWIGDSNQNPTGVVTTEWNLFKIKDQWGNNITLSYEKVNGKQNASQWGNFHTEAIYLKEVKSSDNSKIVFNYTDKIPQEYYEPHTEQSEPDAYQEKYEKKYLQNIQTFNSSNELIFKYKLEYDLIDHTNSTQPYRGKRLLRKLIQENKNGESLPAQEFQYHTTGDYKGGISKIIYPTGGSVTYNYKKKTLFTNTANRFSGSQPNVSGYYLKGSYNAGNYVLDLYRSQNPVYNNLYRYKIVRYHWTGSTWTINEFTLPNYLPWEQCISYGGGCNTVYLDGLKIVHGADYYGLMVIDREGGINGTWVRLMLFHLNRDGKTWHSTNSVISSMESKNEAPYTEDPVLLNGNDFVAIGTKRTGKLRIYNWNGNSWNNRLLYQGNGNYVYTARNNFIFSFNYDGGVDMVTQVRRNDTYYFHYLNSEKKWNTKSWTSKALQNINDTWSHSNFYSDNSTIGAMMHNNPESFLRWDTNYNLVNVDKVLGGHNDSTPLQALSSGFFSLGYLPNSSLIKSARFNGISWNVLDHNYYTSNKASSLAFGKDLTLFETSPGSSYNATSLFYNPNNNTWRSHNFINSSPFPNDFKYKTQLFNDFLLINSNIYKKNENPFNFVSTSAFSLLYAVPFNVQSSTTNGLDYTYVSSIDGFDHHNPNYISSSVYTRLYYANKYNNSVSDINFNGKFGMKGMKMFGGYQQFLNGKSIYLRDKGTFSGSTNTFTTYLHKVIDDNVNQAVEDIVVDNIQIDNKLDPLRKVNYDFDQYTFLPNESVYYGKSTTEHKGYGSANNGKVVSYFNTGLSDLRFLGVPTKTEIRDANNILKSETIFTNDIFYKSYSKSSKVNVGQGYYVRMTKKTESIIQDNGTLSSTEEYEYNDFGLVDVKSVIYENEQNKVVTLTTYANELFPFLNAKNILNKPAKLIQQRNNQVIGTSETKWKEENGNVFPYQTLAGVSSTKALTEITKVNNLGFALEESNGKGVFNVNLLGYNNKYQVARINNITYDQVISNLEVSYATLQTLNTASLKTELLKLYDKLPKASLTLSFYDNNGNLISNIDARKEEIYHFYDDYNRLIYTTDAQGNKLTQTEYKFKQ